MMPRRAANGADRYSLDKNDKAWLDRKAREQGVTMTEVVRQAIHDFRLRGGVAKGKKRPPAFEEILEMTAGTWTRGDAAAYVDKMRNE